jgi:hypothetical protein
LLLDFACPLNRFEFEIMLFAKILYTIKVLLKHVNDFFRRKLEFEEERANGGHW